MSDRHLKVPGSQHALLSMAALLALAACGGADESSSATSADGAPAANTSGAPTLNRRAFSSAVRSTATQNLVEQVDGECIAGTAAAVTAGTLTRQPCSGDATL